MMRKLAMMFLLMPFVAMATTWYVNGSSGSDYNSGTSASSAKATIQAAIDASSDGDTILVAPGTYAPITTENKAITIRSTGGAASTIIDGGDSTRCVTAVPISWMEDDRWHSTVNTNTCFYGFTLKNGNAGTSFADRRFGGGALGGSFYSCVFRDNKAGGGGGAKLCALYNCLLTGNWAFNGGATEGCVCYNCTIITNTADHSGSAGWDSAFINCIIYDNQSWSTYYYAHDDCGIASNLNYCTINCHDDNPGFVDAANGDYRLATGSPCIDAGDNSYVTTTTDLAGNARIANGTVDIGCYEYGSAPAGGSLTDGLVAYYPFDGNANDASGNGYNLLNYESQLTTDRNGNSSCAYAFDGENSVLYRPDGSPLVISNSFSLSIWARTEQDILLYGEAAWGTEYDNNYLIFPAQVHSALHLPSAESGAGVGLAVGKNGVSVYEHTGWHLPVMLEYASSLGTGWNHYVVTVLNNEAPVLYVNGRYVKTGVDTGYPKILAIASDPNVDCEDGIGGGHYGHFCGGADDLRIYNRALSAAEVKALYDGTAVPSPTGLWTVTQYNLNVRPYSVSDAEAYIADSTKWEGEPVTKTYERISFEDGLWQATPHFDSVSFPGNENGKHDYFAVVANGVVNIPEAGYWTFATGVDDGFRVELVGPETYSFEYNGEHAFQTIVQTFYIETPGSYTVNAIYYETGSEAAFDLSVAKGSYSYFDSSAFKLVGDPTSGVTMVGGGTCHTVTFDANGGDVYPGTRSVAEGAAIGALPTPTREGYEFLGWHRGKEASSADVTASTVVTSDLIVYAVWQIADYDIYLDANGGYVGTSYLSRNYGAALGTLPTPTRTGYTFLGWYDEYGWQVDEWTEVYGDATYYANWEQLSYSVTFDANGGSGGDVYTYYYGDNLGSLPTPTRTGYEFLGWYTAKSGGSQADYWTEVYGNAIYYAQWRILSYTVTFNANGGTVGTSSVTRNYGVTLGSLPTPSRTGHTFLGWYTSASGGSRVYESDAVTSSRTLYAHWQANTYTVTFNANGGDSSCSYSRTYGSQIGTLPTASRGGYVFKGWFTAASGGSQVSSSTTVTGNATYYAHWATHAEELAATLGTANVEFSTDSNAPWFPNGNGAVRSGYISHNGSSTMSVRLYGSGLLSFRWKVSSEPEYDALTYSVDGIQGGRISGEQGWSSASILVAGAGWHTVRFTYAKDGGSTYGSDCGWVDSLTWTGSAPPVTNYTVTFNANGGTVGTSSVTRSQGAQLGTLPEATRSGYMFLGWYTSASGGTQVYASTTVSANATYYAHWQANGGGGSGGGSGGGATPPAATYTVTFDGNGGSVDTPRVTRTAGSTIGSMPTPEAEGYEFLGWFTERTGGTQVATSTKVMANVTYYAHWQAVVDPNTLWDEDEAFDADAAAVFDGFLTKDGEAKGMIQVKVGKANKKTGVAKLMAKVTLLGQSAKLSYKGAFGTPGEEDDFTPGTATLTCGGQPDLELRIGRNALWGEMGDYEVEGARNVFAKAGDPLAAAMERWQGTYTLVLETVDAEGAGAANAWGYSGLSLTVGSKGKVKIQGTMVDGAKVNVSSQLLVGEKRCCIPVVVPLYSKKGGFGFNLWLQDDGTLEVGELSEWNATASKTPFTAWFGENIPAARADAALPISLSFMFLGEPEIDGVEVLYDFLPWEVVVTTGSRWTLPAAGSIKYDREAEDYVDTKESSNPAGLKLTYVSKTGAFKGSFKMYAEDAGGRLKKYTVNVSGVMVNGIGYGTATAKGVGSWPVGLE